MGEPRREQAVDADWDLGPCCVCHRAHDGTVRNMVHLDFEAPPGAAGWGCVVCHLPMRGALAIVCDECINVPGFDVEQLRAICGGKYITQGLRVALSGYERVPFEHNAALHEADD